MHLARVLYRQGKLTSAEATLSLAVTKSEKVYPARSEMLIAAQVVWGDLCSDTARHAAAEEHYRKAVEADEANDNLPGIIFDLQRLSDCLIRQDRLQEAEQVILQAIGAETRHAQQFAAEKT